jgi:outer membrane protein assembly factor BamD|tara:strand:+ start:1279 stop:2241 length:963 start_codon:yes stop_codon:yes gene_type:complete
MKFYYCHRERAYKNILASVWILLATLLLCGCESDEDLEISYAERPVDSIYNEALLEFKNQNYLLAAKLFEEVERQHPYSYWASKSLLMAGFSYYKKNKYDQAILSFDRFIQLHPANKDLAYAYYIKGLCYFEQVVDVNRDQKNTQMSREVFEILIEKFPKSKYAQNAQKKIYFLIDHLAGKEMEVARYYQERGAMLAAINRYSKVIEEYQTTPHAQEALYRLVENYLALGVFEEAKKNAAVLGHNFPQSQWYKDAYALINNNSPKKNQLPIKETNNKLVLNESSEKEEDDSFFSWFDDFFGEDGGLEIEDKAGAMPVSEN